MIGWVLFLVVVVFVVFFFFFQAEDGIRDHCVTGVQTCALPISPSIAAKHGRPRSMRSSTSPPSRIRAQSFAMFALERSEERRVGKECRSRWSAEHKKKKVEKGRDKRAGGCETREMIVSTDAIMS